MAEDSATIQAVAQASCKCTDSETDDEFSVLERIVANGIWRRIRCAHCREQSIIWTNEDGLQIAGSASHEDASWNKGGDDE